MFSTSVGVGQRDIANVAELDDDTSDRCPTMPSVLSHFRKWVRGRFNAEDAEIAESAAEIFSAFSAPSAFQTVQLPELRDRSGRFASPTHSAVILEAIFNGTTHCHQSGT